MEEMLSWLADKKGVASSDDYGKDYEHLLVSYVLAFNIISTKTGPSSDMYTVHVIS